MVQKFTLKNGIPVFVVSSEAAPVVSIQAWVSRGSVYETDKLAGISHFLEHALFKGTKKRKVGEIALEVESRGGEVNAFTSFEETVYYATLGSRHFVDGLDIISDAVQNPTLDAGEMLREREVILEEIRRANDSPGRIVSYNLWKSMFPKSPYGRPVLGYESTVSKIDHKTLRQYFEKNYHAGTVSLFVVGDVEGKKVFEWAQKKMGKMKRGSTGKIPQVPPYARVAKPRVLTAAKDINEIQMQLAWPTPPLADGQIPSLDLMCTAVGHGESAPLYQHLVKDAKKAMDISMGLVATARCGMAAVGLQVTPEQLPEALAETRHVLHRLRETGLSVKEIDRIKSSLEAEVIGGKETVEGYARRLGYYYIQFGNPDFEKEYLDKLLSISVEDASASLHSLLQTNPTLSLIHPKNMEMDKTKLEKILSEFALKAKPKTSVLVKNPVELHKKNTVRFVGKRVSHLPVIAAKIFFPGGSREESPEQHGLAGLLQRVWTSGTKRHKSQQIAHTLESIGASLYAFSGRHNLGISMEFLSKHWSTVKPLLEEILLDPTWPEDEIATEKEILLQDIRSERDTPGQVCHLNFLSAIYGSHPYGRSSIGTLDTVSKFQREDLRKFYQNWVHQKHVVVSTVGDYETDFWQSEMSDILKNLPSQGKDPSPFRPAQRPSVATVKSETKQPLFQSHILIGFLATSNLDPDRYALKILASCLAGQGGRLFLELRDRQSLAYQVAPMGSDNPERGIFGVYIGCAPEKWAQAVQGIRSELSKVLEDPIPQKELQRAKEYWIGRFELEMQRYGAQAMTYGLDEVYGIGHEHALKIADKVKSLGPKDIQTIARKYLTLDSAAFSIVHPTLLSEAQILETWGSSNPRKIHPVVAPETVQKTRRVGNA